MMEVSTAAAVAESEKVALSSVTMSLKLKEHEYSVASMV